MKKTIKNRAEGKKKSWFCILGAALAIIALLFACAGIIIDLNWQRRDNQAGAASDGALAVLKEQLEAQNISSQETTEETETETVTMEWDECEPPPRTEAAEETGDVNLYSVIPEEVPRTVIEDVSYMGILTIPALGLELPIIYLEEWEPEYMDIAPCTYDGGLKTHDLIIMAHNYQTHFLGILNMQPGQEVILSTVDGMTYTYVVTAVDVMHRSQKEKLYEGDWDLTLFTCVPETFNRCAVRCHLITVEK